MQLDNHLRKHGGDGRSSDNVAAEFYALGKLYGLNPEVDFKVNTGKHPGRAQPPTLSVVFKTPTGMVVAAVDVANQWEAKNKRRRESNRERYAPKMALYGIRVFDCDSEQAVPKVFEQVLAHIKGEHAAHFPSITSLEAPVPPIYKYGVKYIYFPDP